MPGSRTAIAAALTANTDYLRKVFDQCSDVRFRSLRLGPGVPCLCVFVEGTVDSQQFQELALAPLLGWLSEEQADVAPETLRQSGIPVANASRTSSLDDLVAAVLDGHVAVLVDGHDSAVLLELRNASRRAVEVGKQDAWLGFFPAALLALVIVWLLARVMARFPEQDLYQAMVGRFPVLGRLIACSYALFFFLIFTRDIRLLSDFINIVFLRTTPPFVIAGLIALTAAMVVRGGLEPMARMNEVFGPTLLVAALLLPLLLITQVETRNLEPILEAGLSRPLLSAWYAAPYLAELIILPFIFSGATFSFRHGLYALSLGLLCLLIVIIGTTTVLGHNLAGRALYPNFILVRQIRVTDFLDRMDLIDVGIWLPTMLTKISHALYALCHGVRRSMPSASPRLLATAFGSLGAVCAPSVPSGSSTVLWRRLSSTGPGRLWACSFSS